MSVESHEEILRFQVGAMPLLNHISDRLNLKNILLDHISTHANELIPAVNSLLLLIYNLALGKYPLYKLNKWVSSIDLRCLGYDDNNSFNFTDDRFGRALIKLYNADRASIMTGIVLSAVKGFNIDLARIHNDSTSVKAYGKIPGKTKTGIELKHGHSKDHRPDLKQLIFSLSISADGGVPVHHKTYPGNRSDDSTHIETWNTLVEICQLTDFLYVADSKLCTDEQLSYITARGGRAITIVPNTWKETKLFKEKLTKTKVAKVEIWRRTKPGTEDETEYFSAFKGEYFSEKRGYRLHWIYSSEKRDRDRDSRNERLKKAEKELSELVGKLNTRKYKTEEAILLQSEKILSQYNIGEMIQIKIGTTKSKEVKQIGKGRPNEKTKYREIIEELFTLYWLRDKTAIQDDMSFDGVFPLLSTDLDLKSEEVLKAYKYQPKIEKRFSQFKSLLDAAPLLFKCIYRVEANMFAFFIALVLQALIEREVQQSMEGRGIESIDIYPEKRCSKKPTANLVFELFESVSAYKIKKGDKVIGMSHDKLDKEQKLVLRLLGMTEKEYWQGISKII